MSVTPSDDIEDKIDKELEKMDNDQTTSESGEKTNNEKDKNTKPKFSSKGIFTLILPADDRTDLLVRCTPCQRLYIGIEGWMRHKRAYECYPIDKRLYKATSTPSNGKHKVASTPSKQPVFQVTDCLKH